MPVKYIRVRRSPDSNVWRVFQLVANDKVVRSTDRDDYDKGITYVPLTLFDEPDAVYNANGNLEAMQKLYWNDRLRLVNEERKKRQEEKQKKLEKKTKNKGQGVANGAEEDKWQGTPEGQSVANGAEEDKWQGTPEGQGVANSAEEDKW